MHLTQTTTNLFVEEHAADLWIDSCPFRDHKTVDVDVAHRLVDEVLRQQIGQALRFLNDSFNM